MSRSFPCLVLILSVPFLASPVFAGEAPPYPYRSPPWRTEVRKKLEAKKVDLEAPGKPLREVIEKLSADTGLSIGLAEDVRAAGEKPIDLVARSMPALALLEQLCAMADLRCILVEKGVRLAAREAEDPHAEAERIAGWIEMVRRDRFPTAAEKAEREARVAREKKEKREREKKVDGIAASLRSTVLDRDFIDAPFNDVLVALKEASKVNLILSKDAADRVKSEARRLSIKGKSRTAEKVLDDLLAPLRLSRTIKDGVVLIHAGEMHETVYRTFSREDQELRKEEVRKVLDRKLTANLKTSRLGAVAEELAAGLEMKVFADGASWETEIPFGGKTAGLTLERLAALFRRKGIEVAVERSPDGIPGFGPASLAVFFLKVRK